MTDLTLRTRLIAGWTTKTDGESTHFMDSSHPNKPISRTTIMISFEVHSCRTHLEMRDLEKHLSIYAPYVKGTAHGHSKSALSIKKNINKLGGVSLQTNFL